MECISERSKPQYGSIYATALINALSDASSPLIRLPNEDPSISGSIQPLAPNATQTESFNEFAKTIHDTLFGIDPRFRDKHDISFSAQMEQKDADTETGHPNDLLRQVARSMNGRHPEI